ncbi:olfactory receptor 8D1-like [Discoglossus pictus]
MELRNHTTLTYFIIKGISDIPELQAPIFFLILLIYIFTHGGNMTILILVCLDVQLHTPMYFFLGNLSLLDMFSINATLYKIIFSFVSEDKTVSFFACMTQMYVFSSLTGNELLLLTAMSYDRYVAICNPLRYHSVMNSRVCALLVSLCWVVGFVEAIPTLWTMANSTCFKSKYVNHFFCDLIPLKNLSCSKSFALELYILIEGGLFGCFMPFLFTFISYVFIINTVLKIRSSSGRRKAFYTCSSHLTVVVLLYVTIFCQYMKPTSMDTLESNKLLSLFNTAAVPILNPLIYSLKNKDVKSALKRQLKFVMLRC